MENTDQLRENKTKQKKTLKFWWAPETEPRPPFQGEGRILRQAEVWANRHTKAACLQVAPVRPSPAHSHWGRKTDPRAWLLRPA